MSDTTDILTGAAGQDVEPAASGAPAAAPASAPADAGAPTADPRPRRRAAGLSGMLLPELQSLATSLGISGVARMRKGDLVSAIQARQSGGGRPANDGQRAGQGQLPLSGAPAEARAPAEAPAPTAAPVTGVPAEARPVLTGQPDAAVTTAATSVAPAGTDAPASTDAPSTGPVGTAGVSYDTRGGDAPGGRAREGRQRRAASRPAGSPESSGGSPEATVGVAERPVDGADVGSRPERGERGDRPERGGDQREQRRERQDQDRGREDGDGQPGLGDRRRDRGQGQGDRDRADRQGDGQRPAQGDRQGGDRDRPDRERGHGDRDRTDRQGGDRDRADRQGGNQRDGNQRDGNQRDDDDDFEGRGGSRRRGRFRDRNRRNRTDRFGGDQAEPVISEDDVLLPVAGILDILDNYAFVRTSGYLTGPNDVYVSLAQVRRHGLRRGDAITGAVRQPREGERRDKYNALVRLDTVNGVDPEQARSRPEFMKLTPLYPQERLRLETEPHLLTPRVIDLVMPIGKGQRALIVSPPKAGKTMIMQAIANAVTTNNPECHLMVVLVDERPEEVTDMQRAVKGEVIASTFDRPPTDHTTVAELSIERAKRLVELGHDVVVLLDNITRLGRAYNLAAPASGRILSGGVDSTALYPPKRFLGAARNIEHGGSLTILATALIETGSTMDTVIFEEFKGTGNAELILSRKIADKRVFPAVDVIASGTRKEEILLAPDELAIVHKLRRVLNALDPQQAIDLLLDRLKQSRTNVEFLMQIAKSTPGQD